MDARALAYLLHEGAKGGALAHRIAHFPSLMYGFIMQQIHLYKATCAQNAMESSSTFCMIRTSTSTHGQPL